MLHMTEAGPSPEAEIHPISHWSTNDKLFALVRPFLDRGARIADVGAGEGFFSKKAGDYLQAEGRAPRQFLAACDLYPELFRYSGVSCDAVSSDGRLPYPDRTFDVVCSLEVIEHLQDQFLFTRELSRILKPGGVAIISTPNILNINSRLRNLHSGFPVLFEPLPLSSADPVHTAGHIHPISWYYLAYMLARAGFGDIKVEFDRFKSSSRGLLVLAWWYVALGHWFFRRRLHHRTPEVEQENRSVLASMNSYQMLISRSIITVARRRDDAPHTTAPAVPRRESEISQT